MAIINQIGQNISIQPYANQMNFGQLVGRVNGGAAPHASPSVVQNTINNVVRRIYDRRSGRWYGLMVKGQIISPGYYATGTVSVTFGSDIVVGIGTTFTPSMVGQQFRTGYTSPIYSIVAFIDATHLQIELPFGNQSQSNTGFYITQFYYSFPNIRFFYSVKNTQLMFRMLTNVPQSLLENWDPSRLQMLYSRVVATMPPDSSGNAQYELWPVPNTQQAYPYLAYTSPANLVNDLDNLPAFIRGDIVELGAMAEMFLYRPKQNPSMSENLCLEMSKRFSGMFESELQHAANVDEGLFRNDIQTREEMFPSVNLDWASGAYLGGGGFSAAWSPVGAGYDDY
jgi:hypothetical protein